MLELGLHFSGLMNWVSGLRFSIPIPYWAILLSLTPPSFLFQVRPMSRSNYTGSVLLGFYYYWALGFYHFYRFIAFGLLSIVYVISYFGLSVYVVLYISDVIVIGPLALWYRIDFYIMIWKLLLLFWLYYIIINLFFAFILFWESRVWLLWWLFFFATWLCLFWRQDDKTINFKISSELKKQSKKFQVWDISISRQNIYRYVGKAKYKVALAMQYMAYTCSCNWPNDFSSHFV